MLSKTKCFCIYLDYHSWFSSWAQCFGIILVVYRLQCRLAHPPRLLCCCGNNGHSRFLDVVYSDSIRVDVAKVSC